ncbi:hypothetical protein Patl1_14579 [Pistacia atlantica]|uniref:Uncharacterized protein n=1 Tax=Pistacia atlantica TaxID=434234 RepID=A0ACC1AYG3_9ROSI|nr:hypothetical protein Patl1_14579 [Pistacia atlantica]
MASLKILLLPILLLSFFSFSESGEIKELLVGGTENSWKIPPSFDSLQKWAIKNTFHFVYFDSLVFKYDGKTDSVLEVTEEDYEACETSKPIKEYRDGNTKISLSTGTKFFISGAEGHCEKGQKVEINVGADILALGFRNSGFVLGDSQILASSGAQIMKPKKGDNGKTGLKNQISRRNLKLGISSSNKKLLVDGGVASDNEEIGSPGLMNSNDGGRIEINLSKAGLEPEHNGHEIGGGDPAYDAHGDLVTDKAYKRAAFFVNFSIGDPPFTQLALMDIGNDLVWVDCESSTAFYPPGSHTFSGYTCFDHDNVHCDTCSSANQCMFMIRYVSGDPTYGVLAIEKFTFETSDEGDRTFLEGAATPLTNYNGIYYVDLVGISLGDKRLDIDPNLFKRSTSYRKDEVAIDTGSPYTWLVSEAFDVLRQKQSWAHVAADKETLENDPLQYHQRSLFNVFYLQNL